MVHLVDQVFLDRRSVIRGDLWVTNPKVRWLAERGLGSWPGVHAEPWPTQAADADFTYEDLAARLREPMETDGRLPRIPSARMNNLLTNLRPVA